MNHLEIHVGYNIYWQGGGTRGVISFSCISALRGRKGGRETEGGREDREGGTDGGRKGGERRTHRL